MVAVVADVRFPLLHINPSFLAHLTQIGKKVVIILSKVSDDKLENNHDQYLDAEDLMKMNFKDEFELLKVLLN